MLTSARRWRAVTVVATALIAVIPAPASEGPLQAAFDWKMEDRLIVNYAHRSAIRVPNTVDYVQPPGYVLELDASNSSGRPTRYSWTVTGDDGQYSIVSIEPRAIFRGLCQGRHKVELKVADGAGHENTTTAAVTVRDLLIVSIGDSYASGEGNPETPRHGDVPEFWADSPDARARHFSSFGGPPQAAVLVRRTHPKVSVTFVSLASTGATITDRCKKIVSQEGNMIANGCQGRQAS